MDHKTDEHFWLSYVDFLTSLFFVMLVLFVMVYTMQTQTIIELNRVKQEASVKLREYERIQQVEAHLNKLRTDSAFVYISECRKYVVKDLIGAEIFNTDETVIKNEYIDKALKAGYLIENFLKSINENKDLHFVLIIEGNMANHYDKRIDKDHYLGYKKSYERALAVYNLWNQNGINLRKYNTEIMICGSGFNGICRDATEEFNKRFSIQLIPKIGEM